MKGVQSGQGIYCLAYKLKPICTQRRVNASQKRSRGSAYKRTEIEKLNTQSRKN